MSLESKAKTGRLIQAEISDKVFALKHHNPMVKGLDQLLEQKWVPLEETQKLEKEIELWDTLTTEINSKVEELTSKITEANIILDFEIKEWERIASIEADHLQGEAAASLKRVREALK